MTAAFFVVLIMLFIAVTLMTLAIGGNASIVKENRRLRSALAKATRPEARIAPGEHPIFDSTLAEIMALPQVDEPATGGAA